MPIKKAIAQRAMAETDKNFSGVTIPISNEGDGCLFHPQKILAYYLYVIFHYLLYPHERFFDNKS